MKLYEFAPTRSIRVRWLLQELGVDFEGEPGGRTGPDK
jgi:glutathione S-transferase